MVGALAALGIALVAGVIGLSAAEGASAASGSAGVSRKPPGDTPWPLPTPTPTKTVAKPATIQDPIPYGTTRRLQMAAYCRRHYGPAQATWILKPKAVVLHYTGGGLYSSAHNYFAANTPTLGELPGATTTFIIDKNGRIYQQTPLRVRTRHTIGLNYCAIGIEFVQEGGSGPGWACDQIFDRRRQIRAGLRLVAWLRYKYKIPMKYIYGHGTANSSPLFKDLEGWRNDHVDWGPTSVRRFKELLRQM